MDWAFDITLKNRAIFKTIIDSLTLEELNCIPDGYSNSIIWNIAHAIATQQILVYERSNQEPLLDQTWLARFKKGSKPLVPLGIDEIEEIQVLLFSTIEKSIIDYKDKKFTDYDSYTTSTQSTISSVEQAIEFNNFHEGIHLGYILALRKSI